MATDTTRPITRTDLASDLRALGLRAGDVLLVHSSLSAIGFVEGGAKTVVEAILEAIGPDGTLVAPTFQKGSEHVLVRTGVRFDVRTAPSEMGAISEAVRRWPGAVRSLSPTHSLAAVGPGAAALLAGHEQCRVSVGHGSPFERLVQGGGRILLLGVGHGSNTTLHCVENTGGAPTVCRECFEPVVIDADGREHVVPTHPHMPGLKRRYERADEVLSAAGAQRQGRIGKALARLVEAGPMADCLNERLRHDPLFLIEVFNP